MKIVGISGTQRALGECPSEILLNVALEEIKKETGAEVVLLRLADYNIKPCIGCGVCMQGLPCPMYNNPDDELKKVIEQCYGSDGYIFSSPAHAFGGALSNMTNLWNRFRLVFEKEHAKDWGIDVKDLNENFFLNKPVANMFTYNTGGAGKVSSDMSGRYGPGFKFSTVISMGIHIGSPNSGSLMECLDESDFDAARSVGKRMVEILTSELCEMLLQIVCGTNLIG